MAKLSDARLVDTLTEYEQRRTLIADLTAENKQLRDEVILPELTRRKASTLELGGFRVHRKANTTRHYDMDKLQHRLGRRRIWPTLVKITLDAKAVAAAVKAGDLDPVDIECAYTGSTSSAEYIDIETIG